MVWLAIFGVLVVGLVVGYAAAILTGTPLVGAWQERQRVEHERRVAEFQLRHLSHQAMQRLLSEARDG